MSSNKQFYSSTGERTVLELNLALSRAFSGETVDGMSGSGKPSSPGYFSYSPYSPKIARILNSNIPTPPSPPSWDNKIYSLEAEARSLRMALQAVEAELASAKCTRGRLHNSSSPSSRIPESLLADMFQYAVESSGAAPGIPPTSAEEWRTIRSICATSHHWRVVARNAPRLWTKIDCRLGHFDAKLRYFIERSRAAPIHITLKIDCDDLASVGAKMRTWTSAMAPHLERTETLVVRSREHTTSNAIFPIRARMPLLRSFTWTIKEKAAEPLPEDWEAPLLLDPDMCMPSRVKIVRKMLGVPLPLLWDNRTLAGIKQLTLEGWPGFPDHETVKLIGRCSQLRGLVWIRSVESDDVSHSTELSILHSSTVETLRLDLTVHDQAGSRVMRYMQFPRLKNLTVYSGDAANIDLADAGLGDKTRFPSIETAWLSLFTFSPNQVCQFVDAHPTLASFGCALRVSFIEFIRILSEPASIVPWSMKAPYLSKIYVICASYAWDGNVQSQDCIEGLCAALRALFTIRRAAAYLHEGPAQAPFVVQLNDHSWKNRDRINTEYVTLAEEFPENLVLSGGEDDPPKMFHHVL